jgi:hypothetical protein
MDNAFKWISKKNQGEMYTYESYTYKDGGCMYWDPPRDCLSNGTLDTQTEVSELCFLFY